MKGTESQPSPLSHRDVIAVHFIETPKPNCQVLPLVSLVWLNPLSCHFRLERMEMRFLAIFSMSTMPEIIDLCIPSLVRFEMPIAVTISPRTVEKSGSTLGISSVLTVTAENISLSGLWRSQDRVARTRVLLILRTCRLNHHHGRPQFKSSH